MKKFISNFLLLLVFLSVNALKAQDTAVVKNSDGTATVKIKTSAICDQCKDRIEGQVNLMKGVKKATLDTATKVLTVNYDPGKTSPDKIRSVISHTGYDADDVKADPNAKSRLPGCCRKPE
ncbi:MAG TPA: heavy metal-associated domain-containing protein [Bacteroidia bacterium]|nr:heavy metal-associated domain-containing protein [Bacteroidia bacterium]